MKGSCLCGGVQYEVTGRVSRFGYDHCSRCRKASGSAFMAELFCRPADFRWISGEPLVKIYEAPVRESPPGYRRIFCSMLSEKMRKSSFWRFPINWPWLSFTVTGTITTWVEMEIAGGLWRCALFPC